MDSNVRPETMQRITTIELANAFIDEQVKEIQNRLEVLKDCLDIVNRRNEVNELTTLTLDSNFWSNPKEAEVILKKKSKVEFWVTKYDNLASSVDDLLVFFELEAPEIDQVYNSVISDLESLELYNMLQSFYKLP